MQKIQQYSSEWDAEGVVPYNPEFTANSKHRRTMFAPTSHSGKFLPPQNRSALCVSTLRLGLERRCRFNSPISLLSDIWLLYAFDTTICTLSACAEWGSASYSARGFAPRPHKPSSAGLERALYLSLRSVLYFYFMLAIYFGLLCSFLIPHFSFLIPHSSLNFAPHLASPMIYSNVIVLCLLH